MELNNKVILITGASQGIGKETAILLAKAGANVIITYRGNKQKGEATLKECKKYTNAFILHLDVSDEKSIKKCVKNCLEKFKKIDILINNAGVIKWEYFLKQSFKDIDEQINVNLTGLMKLTNIVLPILLKQKEALIINIASSAGIHGIPRLSPYCGSKFGVRGFTKALAEELPKHVRAYIINPGLTATQMTSFKGVSPKIVAKIIFDTISETINKKSGEDVNVEEFKTKVFSKLPKGLIKRYLERIKEA